ncbi:MAG: tetratricopeptide repeat protein, partial [Deltaproteobacteria bacterium]|nr:tetratricopeptide repeat protein [Deltaproteobacteria bacterium]
KNIISAIAVISIMSLFSLSGCAKKGEEEAFLKAQRSLSEGNYTEALYLYRVFVEKFPESSLAPEGQLRICRIYSRHLGDVKRAMDAYAMLFYIYPASPQVYLAREDMAGIYSAADEPGKAIAEYVWLIENGPAKGRDRHRYRMALEYVKTNDFRQARIELEELLKDMPFTELAPRVYYHIALTHYLEGNLEEAIKAYDGVISSFPGNPVCIDARLGKAAALEESGRLAEALALLTELEKEYSNSEVVRIRIESARARLRKEFNPKEG